MKNLKAFIGLIKSTPENTEFKAVIEIIDNYYLYTPTHFSNGTDDELLMNDAGENEGSCKIFSFARLHDFDKTQTLNCFGHYYREDVLKNPDSSDHSNIRNFMKYGWQHVSFSSDALKEKKE